MNDKVTQRGAELRNGTKPAEDDRTHEKKVVVMSLLPSIIAEGEECEQMRKHGQLDEAKAKHWQHMRSNWDEDVQMLR